MNRRVWWLSALIASAFSGECHSQALGEAGAGRTLAIQICASCHAVLKGQLSSPNPAAPAFERVAGTPGMTARALTAFLTTSHTTMPNLLLTDRDRDDLIAYILSLKPER